MRSLIGFLSAVEIMLSAFCARADAGPERVTFPSADGRTMLTGYLFVPAHRAAGQGPAVVMMHGRAGAYSTNAKGRYDASTLSRRHVAWGELWAAQGYIALLVDSGAIEIRFYAGASHSFDDPGAKRQSNEANAVATEDAVQRSLRFFADQLRL